MHYDQRDMEKLRDLPIEGVAERLGLTVTRHKALCPFHSDHSLCSAASCAGPRADRSTS